MSIEAIFGFLLASSLLSIAPGPDNLFVLAQSALYGKRAGILITLGLCTGLIIHTLAVSFGLAALFATSIYAFTALKTAGAFYLLYLAWQAFNASTNSDMDGSENSPNSSPNDAALYRRGIIMNLSNPKVVLFFLAFLPQFTDPSAGNMSLQLLLLGVLSILVSLIIFSGIALLSASLAETLKKSPRPRQWLNRIAGTLFTALALRLLLLSR